MKLGTFQKQPRERRSYSITYEDALAPGDNLRKVEVLSVTPADLIVDQVTLLDPRVKLFADAGTDGTTYRIELLVTTEDGQTFEDEFTIKVKEIK